MNRLVGTGLASAMLVSGLVATAAPASAAPMGCPDAGDKGYAISDKSTLYKATNLHSEWFKDVDKPTIGYTSSKTGTLTAEGTAGVEAETGAIFAKASVSFSVTVGKSWSKSSSWNYSATAVNKAGKTKVRLTMFHEAKKFKAKKWIIVNASNGTCKTQWKWTKWFTAPVKKDSQVWGLEYK
ncbi:hypothetical protein [Streptomyces mirabilis]|uniref:hypothetical protein n=1 Tax=Streptomyces mirabilis TaxID=68239 RepID=UPI0037F2EDCD